MMNRQTLAAIAQKTLAILQQGEFNSPTGRLIPLRQAIATACLGTTLYLLEDYPSLVAFDNEEFNSLKRNQKLPLNRFFHLRISPKSIVANITKSCIMLTAGTAVSGILWNLQNEALRISSY